MVGRLKVHERARTQARRQARALSGRRAGVPHRAAYARRPRKIRGAARPSRHRPRRSSRSGTSRGKGSATSVGAAFAPASTTPPGRSRSGRGSRRWRTCSARGRTRRVDGIRRGNPKRLAWTGSDPGVKSRSSGYGRSRRPAQRDACAAVRSSAARWARFAAPSATARVGTRIGGGRDRGRRTSAASVWTGGRWQRGRRPRQGPRSRTRRARVVADLDGRLPGGGSPTRLRRPMFSLGYVSLPKRRAQDVFAPVYVAMLERHGWTSMNYVSWSTARRTSTKTSAG